MDNLGVAMNATTIEAYALSKGIEKSYNEMTNQEKIGLAMEMFLEKTAYAAGNYAKENETLAGSLSTAKAALENFLTGSGSVEDFTAAVVNAGEVIVSNLTELLPRLTEGLTQLITSLIPQVPPLIMQVLPSLIEGGAALIDGLISVLPEMIKVVGATIIQALSSSIESESPNLKEGIGTIAETISEVLLEIVEFIAEMAPEFVESAKEIVQALVQGLSENSDSILTSAREIFGTLMDGFGEVLPELVPLAVEIISTLISGFIDYKEMIFTTGVEILTQLIQGLAEKAPELVTQAKDAIMNIVDGLVTNLPLVLQAGIDILLAIADGLTQMLPELIPVAIDAIMTLVQGLIDNLPELLIAALEIILAIVDGLADALPELIQSAVAIVLQLVDGLLENLPEIIAVAMDIIMALVFALIDNIPELIIASIDIINGIADGLIDNIDEIIEAAFIIITELASGLVKAIPELLLAIPKVIKSMVDKFEEKDWGQIGKDILSSITTGLKNYATTMLNTVKEVAQSIWNTFTSLFGIGGSTSSISTTGGESTMARDGIGGKFGKGIETGLRESKSGIVNAAQDISDSTLNTASDWITKYGGKTKEMVEDQGKAMGKLKELNQETQDGISAIQTSASEFRMSEHMKETESASTNLKAQADAQKEFWDNAKLMIADYQNNLAYSIEGEIAMWEELGQHYTELSKEKVEIDKNINKLREELTKEHLEMQKKADEDSFNFSKSWIEAKKALNDLSIQEEIEAWERVADRYVDGSKQKEEAEKNLSSLRDDLRKAEMDAINEMEKLELEYQDSLAKRADEIFKTFSMFADVNLQETNVDKNTKKVEESREAYDKVQDSLKKLDDEQQKAYDSLTTSISKVNDGMSNSALTQEKYNDLQKQAADAQQKYSDKMVEINEKRQKAMQDLSTAEQELTKATEDAAKSQAAVMAENLESQIDEMKKWESNMKELSKKGLDEGLLEELRKMGPTANRYLEQLNKSSDEELKKLSDLYQQKHQLARELAVAELEGLRSDTDREISGILNDLMNKMASETHPIGANMIQGIIGGVNETSPELRNTMVNLMNEMVAISNQTIDAHSPARKFKPTGKWSVLGIVGGVTENAKTAYNSIRDLMGGMINAVDTDGFTGVGESMGDKFINGVKSMGGKIKSTVANAFSGFDVEDLNAKFNIGGTGNLALAGGGMHKNPIAFSVTQHISVGENTSPMDIRRISRRLYDETKQAARSKGADVL